jgi:preprotein translocase subunit Sec61beta
VQVHYARLVECSETLILQDGKRNKRWLTPSNTLFPMAKQDKIRMPSGMGGLTRYFDEYRSKVEIAPGHVIVLAIIVMIIVIVLHYFGGSWLGLQ